MIFSNGIAPKCGALLRARMSRTFMPCLCGCGSEMSNFHTVREFLEAWESATQAVLIKIWLKPTYENP